VRALPHRNAVSKESHWQHVAPLPSFASGNCPLTINAPLHNSSRYVRCCVIFDTHAIMDSNLLCQQARLLSGLATCFDGDSSALCAAVAFDVPNASLSGSGVSSSTTTRNSSSNSSNPHVPVSLRPGLDLAVPLSVNPTAWQARLQQVVTQVSICICRSTTSGTKSH
jgi:hypothetical protein